MCLYYLILWIFSIYLISAEFPTELKLFLEKLFEYEECEETISGEVFTAVDTIECFPYKCDFPRQLCMRPAVKYQDTSSNICKDLPTECITAANGGASLGPPKLVLTTYPTILSINKSERKLNQGTQESITTTLYVNPMEICNMDPPSGRFCGFKLMYTYNKETLQCDEFWFPGCRTIDTNSNLFSDYQECQRIAEMCRPTTTPLRPRTSLSTTLRPSPLLTKGWLPGRPNPLSVSKGSLPMQGNNSPGSDNLSGAVSSRRKAEEDDLGLLGLIQQGLKNAQAIKQGGPQGKQAAAVAAGQLLQQFTGFDLSNLGSNFGNFFGG